MTPALAFIGAAVLSQYWAMLPMLGETDEGMYVTRANPAYKQFLTQPRIIAEYAA